MYLYAYNQDKRSLDYGAKVRKRKYKRLGVLYMSLGRKSKKKILAEKVDLDDLR